MSSYIVSSVLAVWRKRYTKGVSSFHKGVGEKTLGYMRAFQVLNSFVLHILELYIDTLLLANY